MQTRDEVYLEVSGVSADERWASDPHVLKALSFEEDPGQRALEAQQRIAALIGREACYNADPSYMERSQPSLHRDMRAILVDWMIEVCNEFTLRRETFHMSVNFVDRFLARSPCVTQEELQLVGVTALFMASKMEEVYSPKVRDYVQSTDHGYSAAEIVAMER